MKVNVNERINACEKQGENFKYSYHSSVNMLNVISCLVSCYVVNNMHVLMLSEYK